MYVPDAERMLGVQYNLFSRSLTGEADRLMLRSFDRIDESRVPLQLHDALMLIQGVNDFPPLSQRKGARSNPTVAQSSNPRAPTITGLRALDRSVRVTFTPASSSVDLMVGTNVRLTSATPTIQYSSNFESDVECFKNTCTSIVKGVPEYIPLIVSVRELYSNLTESPESVADYPVVVTPYVVPKMLYDLYDIPWGAQVTNTSCTISVAEFEQQYVSLDDLKMFQDAMGLVSDTPVTFVGPNNASNPGAEAMLDIEQMMAMAPGAPMTVWSIAADSTAEIDDMLTWLYQLGNATNPPLVNSASYGMTSINVNKYLGAGYLQTSLKEFQKIALRGLTIVIASGDTGSIDLGSPPMSSGSDCTQLHPDWPSISPYVISVSSTYPTPLSSPVCYASGGTDCLEAPLGEVAVGVDYGTAWTGGGGISSAKDVMRPDFQKKVGDAYIKRGVGLPPASMFPGGSNQGRIYPDLTSIGSQLLCVVDKQYQPVSGTSASAPITAGILALLNNDLMNAGCPPMGWVNPLIYHMAATGDAFNDLTVGSNRCGAYGFDPVCCPSGFDAVPGFDGVGGLGSFSYSELRDQLLAEGSPCQQYLARHT
mmetsp:Transcript_2869/g.4182  ORF Transcript_2869/g.4182 Transcript_2869/m.4182 type:complete len:594 (-) Transcript_2869:28-1809(-)